MSLTGSKHNKIICPIAHHAQSNHARRPALLWGRRRLSWVQFDHCVSTTVTQLKEYGLQAQHRLLIVSDNKAELIVLLCACWRLGCIPVLINPRWPDTQIQSAISSVKPDMLIHQDFKKIISFKKKINKTFSLIDCISFDVTEAGFQSSMKERMIDVHQWATIMATSGSTGEPKWVVHSYQNHYLNAAASNQRIIFQHQDRWLLSLGCYHVAGIAIIFRALISGGAIVVGDLNLETILARQISHLSLVPTQLQYFLNANAAEILFKNIKCVLLGGAPIPYHLKKLAVENKWPIFMTYGMTETSSQIATSSLKAVEQGVEPLPIFDIKIFNQEIGVRGQAVCLGYLKQNNLESIDREDGYFYTGDLGEYEEGKLIITGRKDNMFVSGGENIYPEEIENIIHKINGVNAAIVFGIQDDTFGQIAIAVVDAPNNMFAKIKESCCQQLPNYKIPKEWFLWPDGVERHVKGARKELLELFKSRRELFNSLNMIQ